MMDDNEKAKEYIAQLESKLSIVGVQQDDVNHALKLSDLNRNCLGTNEI